MPRMITSAIVMSRLPRLIDPQSPWGGGLRACLRRVLARNTTLVIGSGTAGADFVRRGAERLGISMEVLQNLNASVETVSQPPHFDVAWVDQQVAKLADELLVLGLRPRGNWHRLLVQRLKNGRGGVVLVDIEDLQPFAVRQELLELGADTWTPTDESLSLLSGRADDLVNNAARLTGVNCILHPFPSSDNWTFLTHTTRECPGPWPEQTLDDYLDGVLDCRSDAWHTALATLIRIVRQKRLTASNRTIRGGYSLVSFTAVPLPELPTLRCFRTHRTRWDFEPYGVCVRHSALIDAGARPVIYGAEQVWDQLVEKDRPYFQLNHRKSGELHTDGESDTEAIDWSCEREWRLPGSLDLSRFGVDDILVFVPTYQEARQVIAHSPWPVTLWPVEVRDKKAK